jgi:cytochrome c oxidase subunit 2
MGLSMYSYEVYNSMGGLDPMASHDHGAKMVAMKSGAAIAAPLPGTPEAEALTNKEKLALGVGASPGTEGTAADVEVNVLGLQFAWIFTYPETGVVSGELHIPSGKEVQLNINAQDVLHAFWVPQFRLKQDAIPGRPSELRFRPNTNGTYPVICAELCGAYHGAMQTRVIVETPEEYDSWMQSQIALQNGQEDLAETLAMNPANKSASEFLTAYTSDLGITSDTLAELHSHMSH